MTHSSQYTFLEEKGFLL